MNDIRLLLARCREMGAEFIPTPDGKLKVRAPTPLPEELQAELKRCKAEVLTLLTQQPTPWPCPRCGKPAEIEAVEPRQDDGVLLTYWHCEPCQTRAVTPATLREPPSGWVSKKVQ